MVRDPQGTNSWNHAGGTADVQRARGRPEGGLTAGEHRQGGTGRGPRDHRQGTNGRGAPEGDQRQGTTGRGPTAGDHWQGTKGKGPPAGDHRQGTNGRGPLAEIMCVGPQLCRETGEPAMACWRVTCLLMIPFDSTDQHKDTACLPAFDGQPSPDLDVIFPFPFLFPLDGDMHVRPHSTAQP